ncbi:MAG: hypothetical protein J4F32_01905 [Dehalococcoidia bacterium]|nr:hypothetical protein [Dehalococcoidia bacterium]
MPLNILSLRTPLRAGTAILLAGLLAACGGGADPTPTPTPAPMSVPRLDVASAETLGGLMAQLPANETACLRDALGAERYAALLAQPPRLSASGLPDAASGGCFSGETLLLLTVAGLELEAGGLSERSAACVRNAFGAVEFTGGDEDADTQAATFGAITGLLFCLTNEEAGRISVGRILGDDSPALANLTLQDARCLAERVDLGRLQEALTQVSAGGPLPREVAGAFVECRVALPAPG